MHMNSFTGNGVVQESKDKMIRTVHFYVWARVRVYRKAFVGLLMLVAYSMKQQNVPELQPLKASFGRKGITSSTITQREDFIANALIQVIPDRKGMVRFVFEASRTSDRYHVFKTFTFRNRHGRKDA